MVKEKLEDPVATLYVFRKRRRPVAVGIGTFPPDPPDMEYDSLLRIPIVANGHRPKWRAFSWRQSETIRYALKRSRWPEDLPEAEDDDG